MRGGGEIPAGQALRSGRGGGAKCNAVTFTELQVGEYEEFRKKKKPSGPLYPLDEEGTYGAPPSALPPPLPGYTRRERKPKVANNNKGVDQYLAIKHTTCTPVLMTSFVGSPTHLF